MEQCSKLFDLISMAFLSYSDVSAHISFTPTMHPFIISGNSARYAIPMQYIDYSFLQTPEEIHVRKLLHLLHIGSLGHLLVVEEHP